MPSRPESDGEPISPFEISEQDWETQSTRVVESSRQSVLTPNGRLVERPPYCPFKEGFA
jgi:hypothetical protein